MLTEIQSDGVQSVQAVLSLTADSIILKKRFHLTEKYCTSSSLRHLLLFLDLLFLLFCFFLLSFYFYFLYLSFNFHLFHFFNPFFSYSLFSTTQFVLMLRTLFLSSFLLPSVSFPLCVHPSSSLISLILAFSFVVLFSLPSSTILPSPCSVSPLFLFRQTPS